MQVHQDADPCTFHSRHLRQFDLGEGSFIASECYKAVTVEHELAAALHMSCT